MTKQLSVPNNLKNSYDEIIPLFLVVTFKNVYY